jgi:hypothetical protein
MAAKTHTSSRESDVRERGEGVGDDEADADDIVA